MTLKSRITRREAQGSRGNIARILSDYRRELKYLVLVNIEENDLRTNHEDREFGEKLAGVGPAIALAYSPLGGRVA